MTTFDNFCLSEDGQLYPCNAEEWAHRRHATMDLVEPIPTPLASSHDQTQLVEVGYNQMSFHMGTVAIGAGSTVMILLFILLCYCAGKKVMGQARKLSSIRHFQGPPGAAPPSWNHERPDWN